MSSVGIGDQRSQVVNGSLETLALGESGGSGPSLLSVVEELGLEQLGHFVGNSVRGVVWKSLSARDVVSWQIAATYQQDLVLALASSTRYSTTAIPTRRRSRGVWPFE